MWRKQLHLFDSPADGAESAKRETKKADDTNFDDIDLLPFDLIDEDVVIPSS